MGIALCYRISNLVYCNGGVNSMGTYNSRLEPYSNGDFLDNNFIENIQKTLRYEKMLEK
jgi:hypothetical protein